MKTIIFRLADGKTVQVKMTDAQYHSFKEIQRPYWREEKQKQRHGLSLERFIEENGFDMPDDKQNPEVLIDSRAEKKQRALQLEILRQGLKTLTDKQASAIHKHFFLGMSYAEIAEEEGISKIAIFKRIECALKKLKEFF